LSLRPPNRLIGQPALHITAPNSKGKENRRPNVARRNPTAKGVQVRSESGAADWPIAKLQEVAVDRMPTPRRRIVCEGDADDGSIGTSEMVVAPAWQQSGTAEAYDERSCPEDVTSSELDTDGSICSQN
jgi:hypothetical protein